MGLFSKEPSLEYTPTKPTVVSLWQEFGEDAKERATEEFAVARIAAAKEEWQALPRVDHPDGWRNRPCPKCGLLKNRQHPRLSSMGGGEFAVGIRRTDQGELALYADAFSVMLQRNFAISMFLPTPVPIGKIHRVPSWPIVIVTCECGCHIGNFRPNDADVESVE